MMSWLRNIFSYFLGQLAYQCAFGQIKRKALLVYLKTLQALRRSLMIALLVFFTLQLMILGFLGAVITIVWLIPTPDTSTKLYILLGFFSLLFLIPAIGLCFFLSERLWFKLSGAEEMLKGNWPL